MYRDGLITTTERYAAAERRVNRRGGWTIHAVAFLLVNAAIFTQAAFDPTAGHVWGWGLGLGAHTVVVLGPGATIKHRLVQRQLRADSRRA